MSPDQALRRFVRALQPDMVAVRQADSYVIGQGGPQAPAAAILALLDSGVLDGDETSCRGNRQTRGWLRRAHLDGSDAFGAQHRVIVRAANGTQINRAESPLGRLAISSAGQPFLESHHIEAGERVRRLVERAQLQPRMTMGYSAARGVRKTTFSTVEISDLAADARRQVASIYRLLPSDCAGVVIDVCGLLKGLQEVERERGWPRRSAKLVLRIGLEQLAHHYGLAPLARGRSRAETRSWMEDDARPSTFA